MSLIKKATLGALLSVATGVFTRVIGLVGTLVLVRYLVPQDYGEVSAAAVLVQTAHQISALGLGLFLVTNPTAGRAHVFQANFIHVALGALSLALVVIFREPLGPLFGAPGLVPYVAGLALALFIERLGQVPEKLLVRELRFGLISVQRTVGELSYTVVSLALAMAGWGAVSVVWGNLARALVKTGIILAVVRTRDLVVPQRLDAKSTRALLSFGIAISVGSFAVFASRRWDTLMMTTLFGPAWAGLYNLAFNLAAVPAGQIGEQISDVLVASFPQLEADKRRAALQKVVRVLALLMTPMAVGLAVTAPTLTAVFLPEKWASVGPFLVVLSALSIPMPLCGAIFAYMQSFNRSWAWAVVEWLSVGILLGLMVLLGGFGPLAAAGAVGIGFFLRYGLCLLVLKRRDGAPVLPLLTALVPPLVASGIMAAGVLAARRVFGLLGGESEILRLAVEIGVGAALYVGAAFVVAREGARAVLGLLGNLWRRRRPRPAAPAPAAP